MVAGTGVTPYRRKQRRSFELRGVPAPSNKKSLQLRAAGDILEGGIRGIAAYSGYKNAQRVDQVGKVADTYDTYVKTQDASFRTLKPSDAFAKFQESGRKGEIPTLEGVGIDDSTWDDKDLRYSVLRRQDEIGRNAVTEGLEGPLDLSQKKGSQAEILRVEGLSQEEQGPAFRKLFLDDLKARDLVDDKGNWKGDYISSDVMDRSFNHTVIKSQADQMASEGKYGAALAFVSKLEKKGSLTAKEAQSREKDILARFNNQVRFKNLLDQMKNTKDTEVIDEQAARVIGVEQAYRKNPTPANLKKWMAASSVMKGDSARLVTLKNVSFKRAFNLKEDQSYSVLLTKFAKGEIGGSGFRGSLARAAHSGLISPQQLESGIKISSLHTQDMRSIQEGLDVVFGGKGTDFQHVVDPQVAHKVRAGFLDNRESYVQALSKQKGGRDKAQQYLRETSLPMAIGALEAVNGRLGLSQDTILSAALSGELSLENQGKVGTALSLVRGAEDVARKRGVDIEASRLKAEGDILNQLKKTYRVKKVVPPPVKKEEEEENTSIWGSTLKFLGYD